MEPKNQKGIGKEQFLAIVNNLADGLMVFDEKNRLFLTNPAAERFFEVKDEEILGKSITEFSDLPLLKNLFYLLGKDIKKVFRKELEIKGGLILEVSSLPFLIQGKKQEHCLSFMILPEKKPLKGQRANSFPLLPIN